VTENEFLLEDRLQKIKSTIEKYGEDNFYLSFSGCKDSTVLSALLDMACPGNKIPRVYANTGIEYRLILEFVERLKEKEHPWELVILKPSVPIKPMLEKEGYPFKNKIHAHCVNLFQIGSDNKMILGYTGKRPETWHSKTCPKILEYQFTDANKLRISDMCCVKMKEEPMINYAKSIGKTIAIIGTMREEGGRRSKLNCMVMKGSKLLRFQPLAPITKEWEDWFIDAYNIDISDIYKPPYNFHRTGCKGCPFALNLQEELDTLEKFFPAERKQCELIWAPVYAEYRRLGYRLKQDERQKKGHQITIEEFLKEQNSK
jgi:3'-phosphoadenosine 5'-phosphosulfate sulfotransferase (PAPS reductase)/FAD synthetase